MLSSLKHSVSLLLLQLLEFTYKYCFHIGKWFMTIGTYVLLAAIVAIICLIHAYYILTVRGVKEVDKFDSDENQEK
jgi:hypothetical protein